MAYTSDKLRQLFQNKFNLQEWTQLLISYLDARTIRHTPERLDTDPSEGEGYFLGQKDTFDNYAIGLFYFRVNSSIKNRRVGLRQLTHKYMQMVDAALVVFDDSVNWRLSFICDIKGENTAPKRYTFVFGDNNNYYNTAVSRFIKLQNDGVTFQNIKDAFSVEALTKEFYNELFGWYQWAVNPDAGIYFPNDTSITDDDFEDKDKKIIRLLTRLMFVWFIKQKGLVPDCLFDESSMQDILVDFNPTANDSGNYYNAILQNLFFATLNRAIEDDEGKRGFAKLQGQRDVKTLYRYAEMFRVSEDEVLQLFAEVPFLNGGLFECLDKTKKIDGVDKAFNYDGFSRNPNRWPNGRYRQRAFIPNIFFFDEEKGLLNILKRYNFTIEENTPNEQTVALDPELLGKVFENLLGAYNPETKETARNQSGSFYTPREIVNYMVDESLKAYLKEYQTEIIDEIMSDTFEYKHELQSQYSSIANKLKQIKILDPACGSGAFPMGLLNRMIDILQKIEPEQSVYDLKLSIIENCIYGSDIQNIAAQISKLRFFISLICDCEKDPSKPNFGIPTLPNLETKFVTANSLIALHKRKKEVTLDIFADFEESPVNLKKKELLGVRHQHFRAKKASEKMRLRKQDEILRAELLQLLEQEDAFAPKDAVQMAKWNPYDQNAVADFFDPEWMFGVADGFDIVIGNPPYIQLQKSTGQKGKDKKGKEYDIKFADLYVDCDFETFDRTGDIYCLFYERGHQLLHKGGHLCYITSNKWMRAGYGEKMRLYFATKSDPQLLIDFAGVKIFESATVDTNILLVENAANRQKTICAITSGKDKDSVQELSDFVRSNHAICSFTSSDSWIILSPIEQSIKSKIESVGTPLSEWDINIYRGILTGYNEAFLIDSNKREELLAACRSEDERKRTTELIRPILRGRDIKRYGYDWANLWLIYVPWHFPLHKDPSIQGASQKAEDTFKKSYPTIYQHLCQYKDDLSARNQAETGIRYEWYAMQRWGANYSDDFFKPKIIFQEIVQEGQFFIDSETHFMCNDTCRIIVGKDINFLVGIMNSKLFFYAVQTFYGGGGLGEHAVRMKHTFFNQFHCVGVDERVLSLVEKRMINENEEVEKEIDQRIYELYHLTPEEINYIENRED